MDEKSLKDGHSSASAILLCQKTVKYFLGEILNYLDVNSYLTLSTPFFCIAVKIREDPTKGFVTDTMFTTSFLFNRPAALSRKEFGGIWHNNDPKITF